MKNNRWIIPFLVLFTAGMALAWWFNIPEGTALVIVPQGATAASIAKSLKQERVISSERVFVFLAKISGNSGKLKAGNYSIPRRVSVFKVLDMISKGKSRFHKITVPEGFTVQQIAELLAADGIIDKDKFLAIVKEEGLEGYLFPETYFFDPGLKEEQIIRMMKKEFDKNYSPEMQKRAKEIKLKDSQTIILASIIEREARIPEERPKISAVFHNRLKKNMYLESCATVLYALGKHKERLLYADLKVNSPYNTYRHLGLPPGPICNPGIASIQAALYPAQTDELFFVVGSSGTHVFSRYLNEHLKNKKVLKNAKKKNLP